MTALASIATSRAVRQQLARRRPRVLGGMSPGQLQPDRQCVRYARALRAMMGRVHRETMAALEPIFRSRFDSPETDAAIGTLRDKLASGLTSQAIDLAAIAADVSGFQASRLAELFGIPGVESLFSGARGLIDGWAAENAQLIVTIPGRYLDRVAEQVTEAFDAGTRWEELSKELQETHGISEFNADRIAVTETGKLNAALNEERQTDLGITAYFWRTSQDERVRPEHAAREGQRFEWGDPPEDGIPGEAINCRCFADPDTSDVLAGITGRPADVTRSEGRDFIPSAPSKRARDATVMADVGLLDAAFALDADRYIPSGGGGAEVGGRRRSFEAFAATGKPIEQPRVSLDVDGAAQFTDGRHRFTVLRDAGATEVPISVPREQAARVRAALGKVRR